MIYYCADDYGLCETASLHIKKCADESVLNKISVFLNFGDVDLSELKSCRLSLHLNLVEGKCMADSREINLIADSEGNFKNTFGGLFKLNLFNRKKLEEQIYKEIKAQVLHWKNILPDDAEFCIDSHQHTHMIPAAFKAMLNVLEDENITPKYIRIPAEPVMPYIKTPSLYFTYSGINIIKQWLLKLLWQINKKPAKIYKIPTAYFMGILFSGKMDKERVNKILPKYVSLAEKHGKDIEVLFHPGYLTENNMDFKNKNVVFEKFYLSKNRKTEFDSVMKIKEGSVT